MKSAKELNAGASIFFSFLHCICIIFIFLNKQLTIGACFEL